MKGLIDYCAAARSTNMRWKGSGKLCNCAKWCAAAGIGAICCLLAALCDMRCRPSLAAAKAWLTTCGHTKLPVRIISSPPSPGASTAACVTPEVNPKGVMAAHRYHSHSKRYNAAAVSYDSSVPGDIARSPGGAVSLGTSAFHNEAFESDSPAIDSLDAGHYNTPLQSGPQRAFHMLEPSQMQRTNSSIHGSAFSRPPSRPGSLDGDASLDSLPLAWPPLYAPRPLPTPHCTSHVYSYTTSREYSLL